MKKLSLNNQCGFALIELVVVMAIAVILATMAIPNFSASVQNNKLAGMTKSLLSEFEYARSEAIKRNLPVTICGSSDNLTCNTNNWESGRLVFVDDGAGTPANRGNGQVDGEAILKNFESAPVDITVTSSIFTTPGYLVFFGDGSVSEVGTMILCDSRGAADNTVVKAVNVSIVGQSRLAYDSDAVGDNVVNDVSGANVVCI